MATEIDVRLHVNIDHVATLRNARDTIYPDPIEAARICIAAGADGITAHLREDRRHIRDADVAALRKELTSTFNLEMAATSEMVDIAIKTKPEVVTLVPERREERTTEGGLDVAGGAVLRSQSKALIGAGIKVSMFIEASAEQVEASAALGAKQVEFHTGVYAHHALGSDDAKRELDRIQKASTLARSLGLEVAAGHGLTRENVKALVAITEIEELNIGHAMIADAIFMSLRESVLQMRSAILAGRA